LNLIALKELMFDLITIHFPGIKIYANRFKNESHRQIGKTKPGSKSQLSAKRFLLNPC